MGKEHRGIKSIYKDYEDWEIDILEPHEPWGASNRQTSIKLGMFMWLHRTYHHWIHNTGDGEQENERLRKDMKQKCLEHHNMSEEDFNEIFIKGNRLIRDKYI